MTDRHMIVGLGNPGAKYAKTRHNAGWRVIDELVRRYGAGAGRAEKRARTWDGNIQNKKIKLVKPLTYMNRSGESVRPLLDYYDIPLDNLMVIHDDLDTAFGVLKLRKSGGHGGQNGLRSIIQHLGSKDFARLRFGIGRPPGKMPPVDFVLHRFQGDDEILAQESVSRAANAVEMWLAEGIEKAMSACNGKGKPEPKVKVGEQLKIYRRAHELAPSDPKPLSKLISIQKKLGQLDEAVVNHLKLADLYEEGGKSHLARAEKEKAVVIQPQLVEIQRDIAEWHRRQGRLKKAVSRYLILADYYLEQGSRAAALTAVETALDINPQHPKAIKVHQLLMQGMAE